jgi:PAS domain S-box-containing protein
MLSSAKKSVPTTKQFIQPYFIEIAPGGAIKATCARFSALLQKRELDDFLGMNVLEVFARLGAPDPHSLSGWLKEGFHSTFDMPVRREGTRPFTIRWTRTPIHFHSTRENESGWQLTGMKVDPGQAVLYDPVDIRGSKIFTKRTEKEEWPIQAGLARYVSDIIVTTDLQGQIIYWNNAAEKFYGIPAVEAMGRPLSRIVRYEYCGSTEEEVSRILRERGFWEGEASYVAHDKKKAYLICSIRYVRDYQRRITGIMAINRDITEIKQVQQDRNDTEIQLRQFSEQITGILESITDGFFVLDSHFRVTLWNQEAERITHLSSAEMMGQVIWEKMPDLVDTDTYQSFHKAFKKKMTVTFEKYNERFGRWLEMSVYPSREGLFAYFKDVTLRKQQEALLALEKRVLELNTSKRTPLRTILNYFLKGIQKIFPGMYCCVLNLDEDGRSVRLLSAPGLPAIYAHAIDGLPIGPRAGSCGTAMFRKETVIVSDIATDPLWEGHRDLALQFGLRACWSIPVLNDHEEVLAAFAIYYTIPKSPTETELDVIERAANLVTLIIGSKKAEEKLLKQELNKQKQIAQAIIDAQEKERAEIGKELHDNINQILSTTKLYLELAKNDNNERLSLINRSTENIHNAIHEIRNISRSLVPASIGDLGLLDALTDLVESVRTTRAIHVEFYPVGNFDAGISDKVKLMLFRIIQEQINNVLKHSGAHNLIIELGLEEGENRIELNITDDGKGFDPGSVPKIGLGLSNIRSRADLFGGKVTILSAPGEGCKLRVQVPL